MLSRTSPIYPLRTFWFLRAILFPNPPSSLGTCYCCAQFLPSSIPYPNRTYNFYRELEGPWPQHMPRCIPWPCTGQQVETFKRTSRSALFCLDQDFNFRWYFFLIFRSNQLKFRQFQSQLVFSRIYWVQLYLDVGTFNSRGTIFSTVKSGSWSAFPGRTPKHWCCWSSSYTICNLEKNLLIWVVISQFCQAGQTYYIKRSRGWCPRNF